MGQGSWHILGCPEEGKTMTTNYSIGHLLMLGEQKAKRAFQWSLGVKVGSIAMVQSIGVRFCRLAVLLSLHVLWAGSVTLDLSLYPEPRFPT